MFDMTRREIREAKRQWVVTHPGVMSQIAFDLKVTKSWVSQVLYNDVDSGNGEIERRLHAAGAPFMEERLQTGAV